MGRASSAAGSGSTSASATGSAASPGPRRAPRTWTPVGTGLPNVVVDDVLLADGGTQVIAVTHGRGMWLMRPGPISLQASAVSTSQINLSWTDSTTGVTGYQLEQKGGGNGYQVI